MPTRVRQPLAVVAMRAEPPPLARPRQRRIGGTGLGLAISLEDAVLHGGALEVWSRRGEGTNFVLTLPRDAEAEALDRPVALQPADAGPDRPEPVRRQPRRLFRVGS